VPASDFQSEGLPELMEWIISSVPGCETLAAEIAGIRSRDPIAERRRRRIAIAGAVLAVFAGGIAVSCHNAGVERQMLDGYSCESFFGIKKAVWYAGVPHRTVDHLRTGKREGEWVTSRPGYKWTYGTVVKWEEGLVHPENQCLLSAEKEGEWVCTKVGWKWSGTGAGMIWQRGVVHPKCADLKASDQKDVWWSTKPGYVWDGAAGIVWKKGTINFLNTNLVAAAAQNTFDCTLDGYDWMRGTVNGVQWRKGKQHSRWPHVISSQQPEN